MNDPLTFEKLRRQGWITPGIVTCSTFLIYWRTLAPDVFVSDFAEFQYLPSLLGLPHPNGFPAYMLLGWLWQKLPLGEPAWEMNLLSALAGALAAGILAALVWRMTRNHTSAFLAGMILALMPTFWQFSIVAERYTLNLALMIGAWWAAWEARRFASWSQKRWRLALAGGMLGISLTLHPTAALMAPFWFILMVSGTGAHGHQRLRRALWWLIPLGLPLVFYLYVPWRWKTFSSWPLLPGIARSAAVYKGLVHVWYVPHGDGALIFHYIAGLQGYIWQFLGGGWIQAVHNLPGLIPFFQQDAPWWLLVMAGIGFIYLLRREPLFTLLIFGFALFLTLMVAYIRQGKNDAYLMPVFGIIAFFAAFAPLLPSSLASGARQTRTVRALQGVFALSVFLILLTSNWDQRDFSRRIDIRAGWEAILAQPIEEQAGLLGNWSDFTPLWYLQHIQNLRTDLWGLFPPAPKAVIDPWLEHGLPLYVAAPLPPSQMSSWPEDYAFIPWGHLVRVLPKGQTLSCSQTLDLPLASYGPIALGIGQLPRTLPPYETLSLSVCWHAQDALPKRTFLGIRLTSPEPHQPPIEFHALLASQWYPGDVIPQGTEGLTAIPLQLPLGALPGDYQAELLMFYFSDDDQLYRFPRYDPIPLGQVHVETTSTFRRAYLAPSFVPPIAPRMGPLALKAWAVSPGPVRPGDPIRVDTYWQVRRPLHRVPSIRIRFRGKAIRHTRPPDQPLMTPSTFELLKPGAIIHTQHNVRAPITLGDHRYLVDLRLIFEDHPAPLPFPIGTLTVQDRPHLWSPPADFIPVSAQIGSIAELAGYALHPEKGVPGQPLTLELLWRAQAPDDISYKVFVHLLDAEGRIVAQHDGIPAQGQLPTDIWFPQEYIRDVHILSIPSNLPPGRYDLRVGMYDPHTGARLHVTSELPVFDDALELTPLPLLPKTSSVISHPER